MDALIRHLSIRQRLLGSMFVLSAVIVALGVWAAIALRHVQQDAEQLLDKQAQVADQSQALLAALERVQRLAQSVMLNGTNAVEAAELKTRWEQEVARTQALLKGAGNPGAAELTPAAEGLANYAKTLAPLLQQVVDAKMDSTAAYAYAAQAAPDMDKARDAATAWVKQQAALALAQRASATQAVQRDSLIRLLAAVFALVGFGLLNAAVARSILRPLDEASRSAERIATGDLSQPLHDQAADELGQFMRALSGMQDSLRQVVGQVRTSSDSIETASVEVASGNLDLSQRTEEAASNLQQTASSLEGLTRTVQQSADAAAQASSLAEAASAVARRGGEDVGKVVQTMEQIQQASRQIADITSVIDGIAFQTNILALNAAVEAARAGEQGRGFAVVAAEVRSLAQRSATAAREIKGLIGSSVERVESGTSQVRAAGQTMHEIVDSVGRVAGIVTDITAAARHQTEGMTQIDEAVRQLDAMTQQNAALVEESAAAAESLKQQAQRLNQVVSAFRLSPAAPAAPAPGRSTATWAPATERPAASPAPAPSPQAAAAHERAAAQVIETARVSAGLPASKPAAPGKASADDDWESF